MVAVEASASPVAAGKTAPPYSLFTKIVSGHSSNEALKDFVANLLEGHPVTAPSGVTIGTLRNYAEKAGVVIATRKHDGDWWICKLLPEDAAIQRERSARQSASLQASRALRAANL